ncbi:MAG: methyltransferase [Gammaproteobacteria bacterium]
MTRQLCFINCALAVVLLSSTTGAFAAAPKVPAAVSAAVADAGRPQADKDKDSGRKPAESVAFAGIKKGEKVADLLPGQGYFTRIFSKVVGDSGVVYAVPPPPRPNAPAGAPNPMEVLAADPAYKNVKVVTSSPMDLKLPEPVDVVWTSLNYHDLHNAPNDAISAFNKGVFNALKPGGTYIVIDHAAAPGSGARDTSALHRIDPEVVKTEVTAAGFVLAAEGDFLKNPADPHTANVHEDGPLRWHTDQFILKFTKPKK